MSPLIRLNRRFGACGPSIGLIILPIMERVCGLSIR